MPVVKSGVPRTVLLVLRGARTSRGGFVMSPGQLDENL
jgi:hypothetical protein